MFSLFASCEAGTNYWIQAGIPILAIAAGFAYVAVQSAAVKRMHRADETRKLQSVWALLYQCRVELQIVANRELPIAGDEKEWVAPFAKALAALPVLEIPNAEVTRAVLHTVQAISAFERNLAKIDTAGSRRALEEQTRTLATVAADHCATAEKFTRGVLIGRGSDVPAGALSTIDGVEFAALDPG